MAGKSVRQKWYRPASIAQSIASRPRVYLAIAADIAAFVLLPSTIAFNLRAAIAWDAFALVYLALAFALMMTSTSEVLRQRAAKQDDSRVVILAIILLAIAASFWLSPACWGKPGRLRRNFFRSHSPPRHYASRGPSHRSCSRSTMRTNTIVLMKGPNG